MGETIREFDAAVQTLLTNVEHARMSAYEYLPEALTELAYAYFLNGAYSASISAAHNAFWQLHNIGDISAMQTLRKVAIASFVKSEKLREAEFLAEQIDLDILGFNGLTPLRD